MLMVFYRTGREERGRRRQVQLLEHEGALSHRTAPRSNRGLIVAVKVMNDQSDWNRINISGVCLFRCFAAGSRFEPPCRVDVSRWWTGTVADVWLVEDSS